MWYIEIDFYLLKSLIKLFIKVGALGGLGLTVDYPKQLVLSNTFQAAGSNEIGPPFRENEGPNGFRGLSGRLGTGAT